MKTHNSFNSNWDECKLHSSSVSLFRVPPCQCDAWEHQHSSSYCISLSIWVWYFFCVSIVFPFQYSGIALCFCLHASQDVTENTNCIPLDFYEETTDATFHMVFQRNLIHFWHLTYNMASLALFSAQSVFNSQETDCWYQTIENKRRIDNFGTIGKESI